jgi:anaerobic selenocysteine-containing dehydrogenase
MHVIIGECLHDADYVERHTHGFDGLRQRVLAWTPQRAAELTGIAADEIVQLAREYATTRPAVIRLNYGVQRSERGATAMRTIALLPAVTGSWKDVGGGLQATTSEAFQLNRAALERADLQQTALGRRRIVNMSQLGQALTTLDNPPVKAMVVQLQPRRHRPGPGTVFRGMRREPFTVVMEQFQTDTDHADILLPVTTFLEHTDLYLAWPLLPATRAPRPGRPGRDSQQHRDLPPWPIAWASTVPVLPIPTT